MSKVVSLLKVLLKNSFKSSKGKKQKSGVAIIAFIAIFFVFYVYTYTNIGIDYLSTLGMERFVPAVSYVLVCIITISMSFSKTKNMLFDSKDNDLLFSLPLTKNQIFLARMLNVLIWNYFYTVLIFSACSIFYGIRLGMDVKYYLISLILTIFVPLIPTAISVLIAYLIALVTHKLKNSKVVETVFNFLIAIFVFALIYFAEAVVMKMINYQDKIAKFMSTWGIIIKSLHKSLIAFDLKYLVLFVSVSVVLFLLVSLIFGKSYKNIILNKSKSRKLLKKGKVEYKRKSVFNSLLLKEFKTYFNSSIYVYNTLFGVVLLVLMAVASLFGADSILGSLDMGEDLISIPAILLIMISFIISMSNTCASTISIEGNKFWILKTMPVKFKEIVNAKVALNMLLVVPISILCVIVLAFGFGISSLNMCLISLYVAMLCMFCAYLGVIVNLKFPKMHWKNDSEVVKQSMSSFICTFVVMIGVMILSGVALALTTIIDFNIIMLILNSLLIISILILKIIINKKGIKMFNQIEV